MVLLEMLEDIDFLLGLDADQIRHIAQVSLPREYPPDTILFREGQTSPYIYLVRKGTVAVEIDRPGRGRLTLETVGPGQLLGWSPLLHLGPMTATARTVTDCFLIALDVEQLQRLCHADPAFGQELLRRVAATLAHRLHASRLQLLDQGSP